MSSPSMYRLDSVSRPTIIDTHFVLRIVATRCATASEPSERADFENAGMSDISRIGDPSVRKRTGISLTAEEPQIRKVIS
jgi:hypothetical protein